MYSTSKGGPWALLFPALFVKCSRLPTCFCSLSRFLHFFHVLLHGFHALTNRHNYLKNDFVQEIDHQTIYYQLHHGAKIGNRPIILGDFILFYYLYSSINILLKGTRSFPSSFLYMEVNELKDRVHAILEPLLQEDPSYFLVHIKVKPGHIIRVYIDGDQGLPIKQCTSFNRRLYRAIE